MPIISVAGHFIYQAITDVGQYYKDSEKSFQADDVTPVLKRKRGCTPSPRCN